MALPNLSNYINHLAHKRVLGSICKEVNTLHRRSLKFLVNWKRLKSRSTEDVSIFPWKQPLSVNIDAQNSTRSSIIDLSTCSSMCFTKTWHGGEDPAAEHESTDSIIARVEVQRWLLEMSSSVLISDSDSERDEYHCKILQAYSQDIQIPTRCLG